VLFRPKKGFLGIELKLDRSEDTDHRLESAGLENFDYLDRWKIYRLKLGERDVRQHLELLRELMKTAHDRRGD
jgi:hypothetical protein